MKWTKKLSAELRKMTPDELAAHFMPLLEALKSSPLSHDIYHECVDDGIVNVTFSPEFSNLVLLFNVSEKIVYLVKDRKGQFCIHRFYNITEIDDDNIGYSKEAVGHFPWLTPGLTKAQELHALENGLFIFEEAPLSKRNAKILEMRHAVLERKLAILELKCNALEAACGK
jgi:hypothetical protein